MPKGIKFLLTKCASKVSIILNAKFIGNGKTSLYDLFLALGKRNVFILSNKTNAILTGNKKKL